MKPGRGKKVVVAMSGGVDSSVAAAMLKDEGYAVVGCFMRLGSEEPAVQPPAPETPESPKTPGTPESPQVGACDPARTRPGHQGCCSVNDAADARLVAAMLDIPFYVLNFKQDFRRVMDYFVAEYNAGRTPNPCVRCNDWLKFGKLAAYARSIDADFIASGHYARVEHEGWNFPVSSVQCPVSKTGDEADSSNQPSTINHQPSLPRLLRGIDHKKDQSYVLFGMHRQMLAHMLLPIGAMTKPEVRALAQQYKLPVFDKPDSQEICFVPDNDYARLVKKLTPDRLAPGDILDQEGNVLGRHEGQQHFTIGQRRGTGVALGHPLYVLNRDAQANTITMGPREGLLSGGLTADQTNWLIDPPTRQPIPCTVKIRYNSPPVPGTVHADGADTLRIRFDQPQSAVTPGQAVVCYAGDHVLGGGWIQHADQPTTV